MNETTVTTPNELEIRVERVFDAPPAHVFSVWTDPQLIPEWWGDGTVVEEMDVRPGGRYRFRTPMGVVEGEFREVEAPERLVQTFQNHLLLAQRPVLETLESVERHFRSIVPEHEL